MNPVVRFGNAQAFWGDRSDAAAELLSLEPELDFLTLDYLAETSMSILALQRERDPNAGFARDFVDVVRSLVPYWSAGGQCKVIANAGGLNPPGCAAACQSALEEAGCRALRLAVVAGDDVLERLRRSADDAASSSFANLDTGEPISAVRDRLTTANAYLGADPIVEALAGGADIVITGRVADPSLVVAACRHHFAWPAQDFQRIAGATIAGHLIECGTQVTGGVSTDWLEVSDPAHIGFPIVEVSDDGSCVVAKPRGAGGRVTEWTVKEQLVYEIGDPGRYLSPDVTASFLALQVEDLGRDRVRVQGALGSAPPDALKVSAAFRDGYRAEGTLTIVGPDAPQKARRCGEIVLQRVREAGFRLRDSVVECLGWGAQEESLSQGASAGPGGRSLRFPVPETVLRIAVEAESREAVERFAREFMPLITAGPQGTTGYATGRPHVHPAFHYWPCLIDRQAVAPRVSSIDCGGAAPLPAAPHPSASCASRPSVDASQERSASAPTLPRTVSPTRPETLRDIACARSGDKGIHANLGVVARNAKAWEFLEEWLTADRVAVFFAGLHVDSVQRFRLPNMHALNFMLYGALRNRLRNDAQGKTLGQLLLSMPLPEDAQSQIVGDATS